MVPGRDRRLWRLLAEGTSAPTKRSFDAAQKLMTQQEVVDFVCHKVTDEPRGDGRE